jgi:enamine deaminase RidA (YjgF/YER057c/UK114 family)
MKKFLVLSLIALSGCTASYNLGANHDAVNGVTVEQVNQALTQIDAAINALGKRLEAVEPKKVK